MSKNFFFHSIKINNYRGLRNLHIESLRRINFIGGVNGAGKSTLLDALFLVLDRKSPLAIIRPLIIRGIPVPFPNGFEYIFGSSGVDVPVTMEFSTSRGRVSMNLSRGKAPSAISTTSITSQNSISLTADQDQIGIHIKTSLNGVEEEASCTIQMSSEGANFNLYKNGNVPVAPGAMLTSGARLSGAEDAQRLSVLLKERRLNSIVGSMKCIIPQLESLQILHEGNQPAIYATLSDGSMLHSNLLGSGFQSVLSIVMLLMTTRNGAIFIDEIDSTVHYSKLKEFWTQIARLAADQNCQVFAATHSRECIAFALEGIQEIGRIADFQYIRLENDDGETDCIQYTGEELADAIKSKWEIR